MISKQNKINIRRIAKVENTFNPNDYLVYAIGLFA
jgi:hypothetical protein